MPPRPFFINGPLRYLRWFSYEHPAYFWSLVIGAAGPVAMVTVPPIRRLVGDEDAPPIPPSYPSTCVLGCSVAEVVERLCHWPSVLGA